MRAVVIGTTFRIIDNWLELFRRINATGRCELISLPWQGDPSVGLMQTLDLPVRFAKSLASLSPDGITPEELRSVLLAVCSEQPDVIFLPDVQSYPYNRIFSIVQEFAAHPLVIGLQHGLFQTWEIYNSNFCVDHLFCFGQRHVQKLDPNYRPRALAVGLPKLDRLRDVPTQDKGYILYLAQRIPEPEVVGPALHRLRAEYQTPIVLRDHPQYPGILNPFFQADPTPEGSYFDLLAGASWIITPHSTGGIEALYLGKPVVLVPNHGLTAWDGYPGIATDFSPAAIRIARGRAVSDQGAIARYLDDVVGGIRFDHTERTFNALQSLMTGRVLVATSGEPAVSQPSSTDIRPLLDDVKGQIIGQVTDLLGPIGPDHKTKNYNRRILFEILNRVELGFGDLLTILGRAPLNMPRVRVMTEHPHPLHSLDYQDPLGAAQDNTRGIGFCFACEDMAGRDCSLLDLGCAGGGIVYDFLLRGHAAVGIEGSEYPRDIGRTPWRIFPECFFHADLTKPFKVTNESGQSMRFNVISAWEVLEHIDGPDLNQFLQNVDDHLAEGGFFVGTVAFSRSPYHRTVMPKEWWIELLGQKMRHVEPLPFRRAQLARGVKAGLFDSADYFADPARGWHFCFRKPDSTGE